MPRPRDPEAPDPAEIRARMARMQVGRREVSRRLGRPYSRVCRVVAGTETSGPLLRAVEAALDAIEAERSTALEATP